jgi:hypothetical protein
MFCSSKKQRKKQMKKMSVFYSITISPFMHFLFKVIKKYYVPPLSLHCFSFNFNVITQSVTDNMADKGMVSMDKVKLSCYTPWRHMGGEEVQLLSYLTLALHGGEWSASRPDRALPPGKRPQVPIG